jgi:hypothetical protein
MTKCINLGQKETKQVKPIKFVRELELVFSRSSTNENVSATIELNNQKPYEKCPNPDSFDFIELVRERSHSHVFDLMFAYNKEERHLGQLFLGYWNDGVVE